MYFLAVYFKNAQLTFTIEVPKTSLVGLPELIKIYRTILAPLNDCPSPICRTEKKATGLVKNYFQSTVIDKFSENMACIHTMGILQFV